MKANWIALVVWLVVAVGIAVGGGMYWRHSHPVVKVEPLPAPTMTVQPPMAVPPPVRPVTAPVTRHRHPTNKKPVKPALRRVPPNYVLDCKMVPAVARTLPWIQVQSAAIARGLTPTQIAQLKVCLEK